MKIVAVRDLRNHFARLEAWLAEGEQIQIQKRGEPIALLTPLSARRSKASKKPDFALRRRAIWGKRVFSEAEVVRMRNDELESEEG
jgi:antitoxin (DNA-binding transcriptional repressor) of toxin-antitoxin stability system